jgi:hypothetical protein
LKAIINYDSCEQGRTMAAAAAAKAFFPQISPHSFVVRPTSSVGLIIRVMELMEFSYGLREKRVEDVEVLYFVYFLVNIERRYTKDYITSKWATDSMTIPRSLPVSSTPCWHAA